MHGVPADLPALRDFHGAVLSAADDLDNIVYFRFVHPNVEGEVEVGVEGLWRLRSVGGDILAEGSPTIDSHEHLLPVGVAVTSSGTRPPDTAFLSFSDGRVLEFVDDSAEFESFCIPHADVYI
jgi:hypothetical protein